MYGTLHSTLGGKRNWALAKMWITKLLNTMYNVLLPWSETGPLEFKIQGLKAETLKNRYM